MCSAGGGLGVATAFQSFMGGKAQAEAQYASDMAAYQNAMTRWELEKRQADDRQRMLDANAVLQLQQLQARQREINEAATEDKSEISLAAMRAKAAAELSAGEANVAGRSVEQILASIESEAVRRTNNVEATRSNQVAAAQMDKFNTIQGARQLPVYGVLPAKPEKDDGFGNILSAALSGLGTMFQYTDTGSLLTSRCQTQTKAPTCGGRVQ